MGGLEALLFDVDGTLAETEEAHRRAFNEAFARSGLDWEWSESLYRELLAVSGGRERILHYLETRRPEFRRPEGLDAFAAGLHRLKTDLYTRAVAAGAVALRPGVRRLLLEARGAGLRLAITTTTSAENVHALLTHSLDPQSPAWFEVIAAGGDVPDKKPAPDIYHQALRALDLSPAQCLAIEDSGNGLRAALAAGVPTLVTVSHYCRNHDFTGAALVLDHLGEPDQPFTVLEGAAGGARYVDVALLRSVHEKGRT